MSRERSVSLDIYKIGTTATKTDYLLGCNFGRIDAKMGKEDYEYEHFGTKTGKMRQIETSFAEDYTALSGGSFCGGDCGGVCMFGTQLRWQ